MSFLKQRLVWLQGKDRPRLKADLQYKIKTCSSFEIDRVSNPVTNPKYLKLRFGIKLLWDEA
jgi:hypothetical protein